MKQPLMINAVRLWSWIDQFAAIGATSKGGVTRLALTDLDKIARDLFIALAKAAGCTIKIDAMGNIFARRAGRYPDLNPVLTGSHGDSQPLGGRFDGIYGVLAGLEAIYTLNDANIMTDRAIDLVMWTNEEGARFSPAMIGSAVFSGITPLDAGWKCQDFEGITIKEALTEIGYLGTDDFAGYQIHAAVELHIEQGPILESRQKEIGIVTGALGQKWFEIRFSGMAAHAGTTPMDQRQDALLGLARGVEVVHQIGLETRPDGRATVGMVNIVPNSRNVVPGESWFTVEFRHPCLSTLEEMAALLAQKIACIATELRLEFSLKPVLTLPPVQFHEKCINVLEQVAIDFGFNTQKMVSGAGHDACNLSKIAPTAMLFIPCVGGISHHEAEDILPEWGVNGATVLVNSLIRLASE